MLNGDVPDATRLSSLVGIWDEAARVFADTATDLHATTLHRRTYLSWTAKQILQHAVHIECALFRIEVTGTQPYEANNMTDYINNGVSSLEQLERPALLAALDAARTVRDKHFADATLAEAESEHWAAVATDRILDLWVHTYDLCAITERDAAWLFDTRAGQFSMAHLIDRLPRVERKARRMTDRDGLRFVVRLTPPHGGHRTIWRSEPVNDQNDSPQLIDLSFESFVGVCSGRPFGQAHSYINSTNPAMHAFATAANHFVPKEAHMANDQTAQSQPPADTDMPKYHRLIESPFASAEDRVTLGQIMLDAPSHGRTVLLDAYERAFDEIEHRQKSST